MKLMELFCAVSAVYSTIHVFETTNGMEIINDVFNTFKKTHTSSEMVKTSPDGNFSGMSSQTISNIPNELKNIVLRCPFD